MNGKLISNALSVAAKRYNSKYRGKYRLMVNERILETLIYRYDPIPLPHERVIDEVHKFWMNIDWDSVLRK